MKYKVAEYKTKDYFEMLNSSGYVMALKILVEKLCRRMKKWKHFNLEKERIIACGRECWGQMDWVREIGLGEGFEDIMKLEGKKYVKGLGRSGAMTR